MDKPANFFRHRNLVVDTNTISLNASEVKPNNLLSPTNQSTKKNSFDTSFIPEQSTITPNLIDDARKILEKDGISEDEAFQLYEIFKDSKLFKQYSTEKYYAPKDCPYVLLFQEAKISYLNAGDVLYKEGEMLNKKFYVLINGELNLMKKDMIKPAFNSIMSASETQTQILGSADNTKDELLEDDSYEAGSEEKILNESSLTLSRTISRIGGREIEEKNKSSSLKLRKVLIGTRFARHLSSKQPSSVMFNKKTLSKINTNDIITSPFEEKRRVKRQPSISKIRIERFGKIVEKIGVGGWFGEEVLKGKGRRLYTAVAVAPSEVIVLNKEHMAQVIEALNLRTENKVNFLASVVPKMEYFLTRQTIEKLLSIFEERTLGYNEFLFREDDAGEDLFILYEGTCQLSRIIIHNDAEKMKYPLENFKSLYGLKQSNMEHLNICTLEKGSFIGEEIFFNKSWKYEYNIKAMTSNVTFLCLNKNKLQRLPRGVYMGIKTLSANKRIKTLELLKTLLASKGLQCDTYDIANTFPLIVSSSQKLSYRPSLHPRSPKQSQVFSSVDKFDQSRPEFENMLNVSKEAVGEDIDHKTKCLVKKEGNIYTTKDPSTYTLEGFIHHLHDFSSQIKITEEPVIVKETITGTGSQETLISPARYQEENSKCQLSKVIQNMLSPSSMTGSPKTEISLRLGSNPSIMKVDQYYSLMMSMIKSDDSIQSSDQDLSKPKNVLGFVPDDFEMDTSRKRKNQKQKEVILKRRLMEKKSASPKQQEDNLKSMFTSYLTSKYKKDRTHRKDKKFTSVGSFMQINAVNSPTYRSPAESSSPSPCHHKAVSTSSRPFSATVRDTIPIPAKLTRPASSITSSPGRPFSALSPTNEKKITMPESSTEVASTKLSRPASSVTTTPMRPFSAWSASNETFTSKRFAVQESRCEVAEASKANLKVSMSPTARHNDLQEQKGAESYIDRPSTAGRLMNKRLSFSPRQENMSYRKVGSIPKKAGGFPSKSHVKVTYHEYKNTNGKCFVENSSSNNLVRNFKREEKISS